MPHTITINSNREVVCTHEDLENDTSISRHILEHNANENERFCPLNKGKVCYRKTLTVIPLNVAQVIDVACTRNRIKYAELMALKDDCDKCTKFIEKDISYCKGKNRFKKVAEKKILNQSKSIELIRDREITAENNNHRSVLKKIMNLLGV